jgi:hypothetical protein
MKILYLLGILLLCLTCLPVASAPSSASLVMTHVDSARRRQPQPLLLTATIIDQKYCAGDAELDGLRINLRLSYTNVGPQTLILYKGSNLVSRLMVSRNTEDALAGRFENNALLTQVTDGKVATFKDSVPDEGFVVLSPGAAFHVETTVTVFAVRGDKREITGAVKSGEHILQVEVPTWPGSVKLAEKFRRRWQRQGMLWNEPAVSAPLPFHVAKNRLVVECL